MRVLLSVAAALIVGVKRCLCPIRTHGTAAQPGAGCHEPRLASEPRPLQGHLKGLTQFGDRRQGTERNREAVDWIEAQLKSYGCATERVKYDFTPRRRRRSPVRGRQAPR